ncbi:gas vesicle protein [Salsuginibacillus halophilus]|uniref:Gas vesicle protein n=1 Tax=Salsuginibacillus halophilus TaxID=517424 RepID=A0A2P8HG26_9BACI|nr:YtxH domain-containing protein [Salsuginibacillus halophilus]PSL45156.1 gas vesicle protein [Salsuginibacillus halophilus]
MDVRSTSLGAAVGLFASTLITLLTTKRAGSEWREKIEESVKSDENTVPPAKDDWKSVTEEGKEAVRHFQKELSTTIHRFREDVEPTWKEIGLEANDLQQKVRENQDTFKSQS